MKLVLKCFSFKKNENLLEVEYDKYCPILDMYFVKIHEEEKQFRSRL